MKTFNDYIKSIKDGNNLSVNESEDAFDQILLQKAEDNKIIDFLTSLSKKGESVDEIFGAVKSIKKKAKIIKGFKDSFDTCGTGGDNAGTFNISTLTALIISCCDVRVAKHGNKAVTSKSGSADVLTELGVNINIDDKTVIKCLEELNLCFLFAPNYHPILKNVADVRKKIGHRTIFNILGPLLNPVECNRQIIGVYEQSLLTKVSEVLKKMNTKKAWVVHGKNEDDDNASFDELTTAGNNYIVEIDKKILRTTSRVFKIIPTTTSPTNSYVADGRCESLFWENQINWVEAGDRYNLPFHCINEGKIGFHPSGVYYAGDKPTNFIKPLHYNAKYLVGGNTKKNAEIIIKILSNKGSGKEYFAKENTTLFNCAAALMVAGKTKSILDGFEIADDVIKSGAALKKLEDLIKLTNS